MCSFDISVVVLCCYCVRLQNHNDETTHSDMETPPTTAVDHAPSHPVSPTKVESLAQDADLELLNSFLKEDPTDETSIPINK